MVKVYYLEADGDKPWKGNFIVFQTVAGNKLKTLNELGEEGWNLSHIIPMDENRIRYIFKRFGD